MKIIRVIFAALSLPVLLLAVPAAYGQSKKEQIAILSYRVDSMLQVLDQERTQTEIQTRRLNQLLNNSRKKSDSLYSLLWRATNNLQEKETRIADQVKLISDYKATQVRLNQALKQKTDSLTEQTRRLQMSDLRSDSLSVVLNKIKTDQSAGSVIPEELLKLTKNNLENYDVDQLTKSMDNLKETRFYEDTRTTGFGVYEKTIGRLVFVRGFVSSDCGDCYSVVLNYYTADGFLFFQQQDDVCAVEPAGAFTSVRVRYKPNSTLKSFEIHTGHNDQLNLESIKNSAATLKNFRGVPSGYRATGTTKPSVFQCVSPRGIE